ncbi:hypothetical protein BDN72DRAFT_871914 [Pluteus cervinus]|uniref:Uncharacterized protein n=1 Tax=Pluteus cervinus TaxID=181527 RepID=A0ACD3AHA4_9AGAR|nr:hypothetical protein BDN72DRAFT_871914 [Pluteus cervinus]
MAVYRLMQWDFNGKVVKSDKEIDTLVRDVLCKPDFSQPDLIGFSMRREKRRFCEAVHSHMAYREFKQHDISFDLPSGISGTEPSVFTVHGLLSRDLTDLIKSAFHSSDPLSPSLHLSPYKSYLQRATSNVKESVQGEVYTSDAFIQEYKDVRLRSLPPPTEPWCQREKIVAALMFSSDSTQLTDFGKAKAWPVYAMLGNHSKYLRSQPGSGAIYHLAYIPEKWKTQRKNIRTHCRGEIVQAVWNVLMDKKFMRAYRFGFVAQCSDGIERRVYPRIFTYSGDYPEKVKLVSIKDKGYHLCPRCPIPFPLLDRVGQIGDNYIRATWRKYAWDEVVKARQLIYSEGNSITGTKVENAFKLTSGSGVPILNAFFVKLNPISGFNPSKMVVVDFLHEVELGVWKTLFTHLLRLLHAAKHGGELADDLNLRYRTILPFGRGTIRKFPYNVSEMKRRAARDYEDLLQCSIPAFEGLLPEPHNTRLMKLLYQLCEWHALAKARMHTDTSISLLRQATIRLGQLMRDFSRTTCQAYVTKELPNEQKKRTGKKVPEAKEGDPPPKAPKPSSKIKKLNLTTYKFHSLGDYADQIQSYGTTDSYSTQLGEQAHRMLKQGYKRTNKKDGIEQISQQNITMAVLGEPKIKTSCLDTETDDIAPDAHHRIAQQHKEPVNIYKLTSEGSQDAAFKKFIPKLQIHILGRLLKLEFDGDQHASFSGEDLRSVVILKNTIYQQNSLVVNYTSYDVRRLYDVIHPDGLSDVMVLSAEADHPYWYAKVIGIYTVDVLHIGEKSKDDSQVHTLSFLWVRWFGVDPDHQYGQRHASLPRIGFVPEADDFAFGFLDPAKVIRSVHLIPDFVHTKTPDLPQGKTAAKPKGEVTDWSYYYVGIFVDRDMYFRYLGGGVGHLPTFLPKLQKRLAQDLNSPIQAGGVEEADIQIADAKGIEGDESSSDDKESSTEDEPDTDDSEDQEYDDM